MEIKIERLEKLVADADQIFIEPEGEEVLVEILEIQKQVEDLITIAKKKIEEAALKLNSNFRSIQSDRVKVYYREYGSQYKIDETLIADVPPELYKKEIKYTVDSKAVTKWTQEHKGLPQGIVENERTKQISFSLKDKEE